MAGTVTKSDDVNIEKQEPVEEIITPLKIKNRKNIKQIDKSNITMEQYKISKLLNDSTLSKLVTKQLDRSKWFFKWPIFCQQKYKV